MDENPYRAPQDLRLSQSRALRPWLFLIALGATVAIVAFAVFVYVQDAPGVEFRLGDQVPPGTREHDAEFRLFLWSAAIGLMGSLVVVVGVGGAIVDRAKRRKR
jgi:hypothetical protein